MCVVRVLEKEDDLAMPDLLADQCGFVGSLSWLQLVESVYRYPSYRLVAESRGTVLGYLVLTHIRHPIFGSYLVTAPFASYGGFCYTSYAVRDSLLQRAMLLMRDLNADYATVRFCADDSTPPDGWLHHSLYATYLVDINQGAEQLMSCFRPNHRNHVRKVLKKNFTIQFGHFELLDDVYERLSICMQELGSPYHSKGFLQEMAKSMGSSLEFAVVSRLGSGIVGVGVFITHGKTVTNLHANILRKFRSEYAGEFLYWAAFRHYIARGYTSFDLGRSLIGSGNEVFKMKWASHKHDLATWYALPPGKKIPELHQNNPRFRLAIEMWKRLPRSVARALGPSIIRGLA